jgi:hypothetical protein
MRGRPGASQEIIVRDSEFRKTGPEKEPGEQNIYL